MSNFLHNRKFKGSFAVFAVALIALCILCLINYLLAPIMLANDQNDDYNIAVQMYPGANEVTIYDGEYVADVMNCYKASTSDGDGYIVMVRENSGHGEMLIAIALSPAGYVKEVRVLSQEYSAGARGDVAEPSYLENYVGKDALDSDTISKSVMIPSIPGAELEADEIFQAVLTAFEQYDKINEGN